MLSCALLWQNCQSNSFRAVEEKRPEGPPLESGWQPPASETLTRPIGYFSSLPSTTAIHQPKVPPTAPSLPILPGASPSAAFEGAPSSMGIHASARITPSSHILAAPDSLPPAAMSRAAHAVPLRSAPTLSHASASVFTSASGERVRFSQVEEGQWQATVQAGADVSTLQRTLPVVGPADIGDFLSWLQGQDKWTSRARVHILHTTQAPYGSCVYLGQAGLLGGMPDDEEEDAKPPAKRPLPSPENTLAESNKKVRTVERCVRRDTLSTLLDVAKLVPDKTVEFPEILLAAAKSMHFPQQVPEAFGAVAWKRYFGDVGSVPALPSDIGAILGSSCPFWPSKKMKDTHLLVLVPAAVDGAPFTLNLLGELIQRPKNDGHKTQYGYYGDKVRAQFGEKSPGRSYWLLMTRDVLRGSRGRSYVVQKGMVAKSAKKAKQPYELPSALEAATAILMHHACTGTRLLGDDPLTYTRCQELIDGQHPVIVGGFESLGLSANNNDCDYDFFGVVCCRRF
jgi:hypothetical protein